MINIQLNEAHTVAIRFCQSNVKTIMIDRTDYEETSQMSTCTRLPLGLHRVHQVSTEECSWPSKWFEAIVG